MPDISSRGKGIIVAILVAGVTILHYVTGITHHHLHIIYQGLYYIPLILAAFWFGLRGAVITCLGLSALYGPFILIYWEGFSQNDFSRIMEIAHYFLVAIMLGVLKDRESSHQKRLRLAERLAAMGSALSGVAHDMKTPLIAIGGFSKGILTRAKKIHSTERDVIDFISETDKKLSIVVKETQRLENMVKDMLDFSRPLELHRSKTDLADIVRESLSVIANVADERKVKIICQPSHELPPVLLDSMRMKQALVNLLINAVQASPEGETVTVCCSRNGKNLLVDVTDRGSGIPRDKRDEIFMPFFTTKKDGTGLGLPIVKKIVEAHHGRVELSDSSERGATFTVVLPMGLR